MIWTSYALVHQQYIHGSECFSAWLFLNNHSWSITNFETIHDADLFLQDTYRQEMQAQDYCTVRHNDLRLNQTTHLEYHVLLQIFVFRSWTCTRILLQRFHR